MIKYYYDSEWVKCNKHQSPLSCQIIITYFCVLLIVSAMAFCGRLGQQDFVGFVPSLALAPVHVKLGARCSGTFVGQR